MSEALWELWKTRSVRFPKSGGRVLCVHGSGSFHRPLLKDGSHLVMSSATSLGVPLAPPRFERRS